MNMLDRFPYLSKCCICITLKVGSILVGFATIFFHTIYFILRDLPFLVAIKKETEQRPTETTYSVLLLLLLIHTLCVRLLGFLSSVSTVAGALKENLMILKLSVWTNLFVLVSLAVGIIWCTIQLFIDPILFLIVIILFDLLLFVFLQYFFLVINSYYQYLLQIKEIELQESGYVTYVSAIV